MDPANLPSNPDENGASDILGSTVFIVSLATIVVLARLYVRVFIIRGTGWDVSLLYFNYFYVYCDYSFARIYLQPTWKYADKIIYRMPS